MNNIRRRRRRGYGTSNVRFNRLYFDGDERKFELWYAKFMGYLKLRGLKDVIDPPTTNTNNNTNTQAEASEDAGDATAAAAAATTTTGEDKNAEV